MNNLIDQLHDAVDSYEAMAAGREPDRTRVITGALALSNLCERQSHDRDLADAATGLTTIAIGGAFALDGANRLRAARLAEAVRHQFTKLVSSEHIDLHFG